MRIEKFTDLNAWQEGHKLVIGIYKLTKHFPSEERFSLTSQIRRAAVSITSNIAEGFGRQTKKDQMHYYIMARGSVLELQNQLLIARDIEILPVENYTHLQEQSIIVHKILNGLIRSVRNAA